VGRDGGGGGEGRRRDGGTAVPVERCSPLQRLVATLTLCFPCVVAVSLLLLQEAVKVVQQFMARDPGELRFTIVAIAANTGDDEEDDA